MNSHEENQNIYRKLREVRRARGLTTTSLGEKIGEDPQKVSRIERGARNLTVDYLLKISKALETPLNELIEDQPIATKAMESSPNTLHEVIMLIEEHSSSAFSSPSKKAEVISKIYELTLKFPKEQHSLFLTSLAEVLKLFLAS